MCASFPLPSAEKSIPQHGLLPLFISGIPITRRVLTLSSNCEGEYLELFSSDGSFDFGKYKLYAAARSSCARRSILPRRGVGVGGSLAVAVAAWRQRGGQGGGSLAAAAAFLQLGGGGRSAAAAAAAVAAARWRS